MAAYGEYVKRSIATGKSYEDLPPRIQALFPYHLSDFVCRVQRTTPFRYYSDLMYNVLKEEKSYDRIPNFTAADALRVLGVGRNEYIAILNGCKAKKLMWRVNRSVARELLPTEPLPVQMQPWWMVSVVNLGEAEFRELNADELAHLKTANLPDHIRVKDLEIDMVRQLYQRGLIYLDVPVNHDDRFSILPLEGFVSNKTSDLGDNTVDPIESLLYAVFVASSERLKVSDLATILNADTKELQSAISIAVRLGFATRITDEAPKPLPADPTPASTDSAPSAQGEAEAPAPGPLVGDLLGLGDFYSVAAPEAMSKLPGQAEMGVEPVPGLAKVQAPPPVPPLPQPAEGGSSGEGGHAIAVVVDAEATSYLMMGALSPGLKRHSVTLFEGGRVSGEEVMKELISELWVSYAAGQGFEGDMLKLTNYAAALATTLETVRSASNGRTTDCAQCLQWKVLYHAYCAVVPITPLPFPPLPLVPDQPGPAYFGPTAEATGPWHQLALYAASRCGPQSLVFKCGQRVWRLPSQLEACTHAMLWPWDIDPDPASRAKAAVATEASFLLYHLNEMLGSTAVMVQPLGPPSGSNEDSSFDDSTSPSATRSFAHQLSIVDVPLPLDSSSSSNTVRGIERRSVCEWEIPISEGIRHALDGLGLSKGLGYIRMMRLPQLGQSSSEEMIKARGPSPRPPSTNTNPAGLVSNAHSSLSVDFMNMSMGMDAAGSGSMFSAPVSAPRPTSKEKWVPLCISLGMPLYCLELCKMVCRRAVDESFLSLEGRTAQINAQSIMQARLSSIISLYSSYSQNAPPAFSPVQLPTQNLLFDGTNLVPIDLSDFGADLASKPTRTNTALSADYRSRQSGLIRP
eukprot:gene5845-6131_t